MDAAVTQLVQSLAKSVQELAAVRSEAADKNANLKYAELTGRIDTMRTVIAFFQQATQANVPPAAPEAKPEPEATEEAAS